MQLHSRKPPKTQSNKVYWETRSYGTVPRSVGVEKNRREDSEEEGEKGGREEKRWLEGEEELRG